MYVHIYIYFPKQTCLWGIMTSSYCTNKHLHGLNILTTNKKIKYWHHETADLEEAGQSPAHTTLAVCTQHKEQPLNQNQL